jgi:hypothetical protein
MRLPDLDRDPRSSLIVVAAGGSSHHQFLLTTVSKSRLTFEGVTYHTTSHDVEEFLGEPMA